MFTFIGGGETTKDDVEAQQLQETQEEAQQLQETQEENLATTPSSGFQLVPLEEKKGKSVTFNVDKSFQEDPEREDAGDKPEEDTKTQQCSWCCWCSCCSWRFLELCCEHSGITKLKSIFTHTYIGKVQIDLKKRLNYKNIGKQEQVIEVDSYIRNTKKENQPDAKDWNMNQLGEFKASLKISKKLLNPDIDYDEILSPTASATPKKDQKSKSWMDITGATDAGGTNANYFIEVKVEMIELKDVKAVDLFHPEEKENRCYVLGTLKKKNVKTISRSKIQRFRSKTVYRDNSPTFTEKKLKDFKFQITDESKKWDNVILVFEIYNENEGAQEITDGFMYIKNYFTHVMMTQASDSIWLEKKNVFVSLLRFLAFIEIFAWLIICGYFAYESYMQGVNQRYASLAEVNDGICELVPRQLDIDSKISIGDGTMGVWSSDSSYAPNTTAYSIELRNYEAPMKTFEGNVRNTEKKLKGLSEIGAERSLHWNLILWATFTDTQYLSNGGRYVFKLEGDVQTLFNKPKILAGMATKSTGYCEIEATSARYDLGSQSFVLKIEDYFTSSGVENGKCPQAFDPVSFGIQNASITTVINDLEIQFDMQAVSVALAINMGQIEMSELSRVALSGVNLTFPYDFCNTDKYFGYTSAGDAVCAGLRVVDWSAFYLPRYKGMQPVTCVILERDDGTEGRKNFCLIRVGDALAYPTIHHVDQCSCSDVKSSETVKAECNEQKLLTTMFYYPGETVGFFPLTLEAVAYLQTILWGNPTGDDELNNVVYPSARALANRALESDLIAAITTMCPYFNCTIITFHTVANYNNFAINDYVFQIAEPACTPSVYNAERFSDLLSNTPLNFYEKYQKCRLQWQDNWIQSVGISTGNASILTQLMMFALTLMVGQILKHGYQYSTGFGDSDYAATLDKKRRKAIDRKNSENFFEWFDRIFYGHSKSKKDEDEDEDEDEDDETDWEDPKVHSKLKRDFQQKLDEQKEDLDVLKKKLPFTVAIPKEKLESNIDKLDEQRRMIDNLQSLYDELKSSIKYLDDKYEAVDDHAKKAMRVVSSWTPTKGGNASIDDDKSVISNPGVVYSNADKEEMRKHLSSLLHK